MDDQRSNGLVTGYHGDVMDSWVLSSLRLMFDFELSVIIKHRLLFMGWLLTALTTRSRLCCLSADSLCSDALAPPEGALSHRSVSYSVFRVTIALDR
ncbi:hypothetical protein NDU88_001357 [Pleurodeles waltl]|uniref:Uncharacterized protein n=1 Tax=Pleurodeles waltl TaxID=8319 RepID=A0AAV7U7P1_PLEWA|nr:hypothetical protein NDU88_001357 [Pleurodeles waltl]